MSISHNPVEKFCEYDVQPEEIRNVLICRTALIGQGRSAKVYSLGAEKVVKLYDSDCPLNKIENEYRNGHIIHDMGINCPKTYGIVRSDDNYGILYESYAGYKTFEGAIEDNFNQRESLIRQYIQGIRGLHSFVVPAGAFPDAKQCYMIAVNRLSAFYGQKHTDTMRKMLEHISDRNTLLQIDCHIGNCFVNGDSPVFFDFEFVGYGHPILDLTAMYTHLVYWPVVNRKGRLSVTRCREVFDVFLREYLGTRDEQRLANAERQLRCISLMATALNPAFLPSSYREKDVNDALVQIMEDGDWFAQQEIIE